MGKPRVFISYRHADLLAMRSVERIYAELCKALGEDHVFLDNRTVRIGQDLRNILQKMEVADFLLVLIGPEWPKLCRGNPDDDWVSNEIKKALEHKVPLIPVLLDNAEIPEKVVFPVEIQNVSFSLSTRLFVSNNLIPDQIKILVSELRRRLTPPWRRYFFLFTFVGLVAGGYISFPHLRDPGKPSSSGGNAPIRDVPVPRDETLFRTASAPRETPSPGSSLHHLAPAPLFDSAVPPVAVSTMEDPPTPIASSPPLTETTNQTSPKPIREPIRHVKTEDESSGGLILCQITVKAEEFRHVTLLVKPQSDDNYYVQPGPLSTASKTEQTFKVQCGGNGATGIFDVYALEIQNPGVGSYERSEFGALLDGIEPINTVSRETASSPPSFKR